VPQHTGNTTIFPRCGPPALRSDNDHTRSGLLDKLEHSLLGKPVHNHKKRKIVDDHTRIGKDGKVYHAKHYVKCLLHEDSVIGHLPHRCNSESHPKIEQIHSCYSLSDKQKRECCRLESTGVSGCLIKMSKESCFWPFVANIIKSSPI
jgi:hypothetical protein